MLSTITLTVRNGLLAGRRFTFREKQKCLVGRSAGCDLALIGYEFLSVSRYHCLLDLDPPEIAVRDLCSRNGTFVNGVRVCNEIEDRTIGKLRHSLKQGDEVRIGDTVFVVEIESTDEAVPAQCVSNAELVALA